MMSREVLTATGALLESILDDSHPLWGEGMDRKAYERYNAAQLETPWGASHMRRVALVENGRVLSSAKRYDVRLRLDGRILRTLGIGAVFTPPALRRRGHAAELIRRMVADAATEGCEMAMLFSEISPAYYARLGFEPVPLAQQVLRVDPREGPPLPASRPGRDTDAAALLEIHEAQAAAYRLTMKRDEEFIRYTVAKKRLLAELGPQGLRGHEFLVSEDDGWPVAFVTVLVTRGYWVVTDVGDCDPSGAVAGALLQSLVSRTAGRTPLIRAWLPSGFLPPQFEVLRVEPASVVMMIRPLSPEASPRPRLSASDVFYSVGDVF
jgi:predicted N-acetyltransferase YhbS